MRSKIIIVLSLVLLLGIIFIVVKDMSVNSIDEYIGDEEDAYSYSIDGYNFYSEDTSSNDAINVTNLMSLMGLDGNVVVSESFTMFGEDESNYDYDIVSKYTDDIDTDYPIYFARSGDLYYVWTDTDGTLRGMHLDDKFNLIELR